MTLAIDAPVRAVVFDAVGTIMYPQPGVAAAYQAAIARHYGREISADVVALAVREALQSRSTADELTTSEQQERDFWADLVRTLCPEGDGFEACFEDLFAHFAAADNWRCFPETGDVLTGLQERGLAVAIASNFDDRLNSVCAGLPAVASVPHRIVSSEVGYRKPAREFFAAVCETLQLEAEQILMVGDDPTNDVAGARQAGLQAVLIDRSGQRSGSDVVSDLRQLLTLAGENEGSTPRETAS